MRARRGITAAAGVVLALVLTSGSPCRAQAAPESTGETPPSAGVVPEDGPRFEVTQIELGYAYEHPRHPSLGEAMDAEVKLGEVEDGYVAPRAGVPSVVVRLKDVPGLPVHGLYASAINSISRSIAAHFNRLGLIGVFVAPAEEDIDERTLEDRRPETRPPGDETKLLLVVWTGIVSQVRTLASGERVPHAERIDNPVHAVIRERCPVQPAAPGALERDDLLRKDVLDDYIFRLNRHPGRRVDVAVASAGEPGEVALDLLIAEGKPWMVYAEVSNTGTDETSEWRERFSFSHNQVTGNDDILTLEYITAGFDEAHSVVGAYEAPLWGTERLRWRAFASWNEFTASDVGLANEAFDGDGWLAGAELTANVLQRRDLFIDGFIGARWQNITVENQTVNIEGDEDFFLPNVGVRVERVRQTDSLLGSAELEWNMPGVAGTDPDEIDNLGRLNVDDDWTVLKWDLTHSAYLEPLINRAAWEDSLTPESSTLAHEVALSFRGQYAFDDRLIPHAEAVVGGLYSVRGYDETLAIGDTAYIGSAEYRYHVPRAFKPRPVPGRSPLFGKPFRFAPQAVYGRPDWDLILRTFVDVGLARINQAENYESDEDLVGAGVGAELQVKERFGVRVDYGRVFSPVGEEAEVGDGRFHVILTVLF